MEGIIISVMTFVYRSVFYFFYVLYTPASLKKIEPLCLRRFVGLSLKIVAAFLTAQYHRTES